MSNENQLLKMFRKLDTNSKENVMYFMQGMILAKQYPKNENRTYRKGIQGHGDIKKPSTRNKDTSFS